jgi:Sec-independent protein translocase protein TatA
MITTRYRRWAWLGVFLFPLVGTSAFSQEKGKEGPAREEIKTLPKTLPKSRSLVRAGYTRPGSPSDKLDKNGAIIQAALDPGHTGAVIGATVYFAVFQGTGAEDDVFGGELAGIADAFVAGRSFENSVSPRLDRKARYLYLYQIVNDRGLNPPKDGSLPPVDGDIKTAPIAGFALRLLVDPRYITSWGHFTNIGFDARVTDRKVGKDETHVLPMALSSNPAVVRQLPDKRFQEGSPAYELGNLLNGFGLDKSNLNLQNSSAYATLVKKKLPFNWAVNMAGAAVAGGREPDFVQVVYNAQDEDFRAAIGDTIFRVDFKKTNVLAVAQHSVVFGFTSDLPPTDEPCRVEGPMSVAPGVGQAPAIAVGTAPTPVAAGESAPMISSMIGGGNLGGGGLGGAFLPLPGALFGAARAPAAASAVGSSVPGNTQAAQTQAQNQNQNQSQQQAPSTINFNATLSNQQSQQQNQQQQQSQTQQQQQSQTQSQVTTPPGQVVPAPPAVILGLLGMPAFYFFRRRGNNKAQTAKVP